VHTSSEALQGFLDARKLYARLRLDAGQAELLPDAA
jgi:hypothetical protein